MELGPELIVNGGFDTGTYNPSYSFVVADGWQHGNGNAIWPQADGKVTFNYIDDDTGFFNDFGSLWQEMNIDPTPSVDPAGLLQHNHTYQVQFTIGGGNTLPNQYLYVHLGEILSFHSTAFNFPIRDGRVTFYAVAHANYLALGVGEQGIFFRMGLSNCSVTLDDVSVREVISGLPLGPELITNGSFTGNADGSTLVGAWSYNDNNIHKTGGATTVAVEQSIAIEANKYYYVSVTVDGPDLQYVRDHQIVLGDAEVFSDDLDPRATQVSNFIVHTFDDAGAGGFPYLASPPLTTQQFRIYNSSDFQGTMDDISVREVMLPYLPAYNSSLISAVSRTQQDLDTPQFLLAGQGGASSTTYALFKKATDYVFSNWRSPVYQIGKPFTVLRLKIPVVPAITTDMEITPVLYFDNEERSAVGTVINDTNYDGEKVIVQTSKNFGNATNGKKNFFLELQFSGSALATVSLPIHIDLEVDPI